MPNYREAILKTLLGIIEPSPHVVAAWEAGSAANNTTDAHSDLDLVIVAQQSVDPVFELVEQALTQTAQTSTLVVESHQSIPNYHQRLYFLEGAPRFFYADVGVFSKQSKNVLDELMIIDRHGTPAICFDKEGLLVPTQGNKPQRLDQLKNRLTELEGLFRVYKTNVHKELERDHPIDALAFYQVLVRFTVEALGMSHRPFQSDFGLRYLHRSFPTEDCQTIEDLLCVSTVSQLKEKVPKLEDLFLKAVTLASEPPAGSP